jgi:hypothetical protein
VRQEARRARIPEVGGGPMVSEPCSTAKTPSAFGERAERPDERAERELLEANARLRAQVEVLELRVQRGEERRRAMLHIMGDLNESNKRLANQRKAMLHILADYEQDRRRLARQTERLDNSRRALLHILQDSHKDKVRLEASRRP